MVSKEYKLAYPVYPIAGRLKFRPYAEEFFLLKEVPFDEMPFRTRGVVLHDILSRVIVPDDLESAVNESVAEGLLPSDDAGAVIELLSRRISAHPEFFPAAGKEGDEGACRVLRERSLVCRDGSLLRPDRIIIHPDRSVLVVDYKFAREHQEHLEQVASYREVLKDAGYQDVRTVLWYVYPNRMIF